MAERPHSLLDDDEVLCNLRHSKHDLIIPSLGLDLVELISSCWLKCDYDRPTFNQLNHLLCQKQQQLITTTTTTNNSDTYQPMN
jgi:hypothetical protein